MVIDTSAVLAILFGEPEARRLAQAIEDTSVRRLSAATLLEASIVIETRHGFSGGAILDRFVVITEVQVEPVTAEQAAIARIAFRSFGKGHHPAALNFIDCFSYALSKAVDEPLLFKGNDFALTDVKKAGLAAG